MIVVLFSLVNLTHARGYGSGGGEGENCRECTPGIEVIFFMIHDINKDAFLSPEEAALIKMSNETFEQADTNRDSKLNKTEFLKIWENLPR